MHLVQLQIHKLSTTTNCVCVCLEESAHIELCTRKLESQHFVWMCACFSPNHHKTYVQENNQHGIVWINTADGIFYEFAICYLLFDLGSNLSPKCSPCHCCCCGYNHLYRNKRNSILHFHSLLSHAFYLFREGILLFAYWDCTWSVEFALEFTQNSCVLS